MEHDPAALHLIAGQPVLRMQRRLAHAPEKVWRAITDPAELAHWFPARVETELKVGATMRFTFEGQGEPTTGRIIEFEPPKLFVFSWNDDVLRWEIVPEGAGCRLLFSHSHSAANGGALGAGRSAAGWDVCLAALAARLDGAPPAEPPADMFERIAGYVARFGLAEGEVREHPDGHVLRFERDLVWRPPAQIWATLVERAPIGDAGRAGAGSGTEPTRPVVGAAPPAGSVNDYVPAGTVTTVDPPHVLEYAWLHDGEPAGLVRWEVLADPKMGNRIVVTQTVPARLAALRPVALAAWQTHLELFFAALFGSPRPWSAERTAELEKRYTDRLA